MAYLSVCPRTFLQRINVRKQTRPACRWHHPQSWGLCRIKGKRTKQYRELICTLLWFLTALTCTVLLTIASSPWCRKPFNTVSTNESLFSIVWVGFLFCFVSCQVTWGLEQSRLRDANREGIALCLPVTSGRMEPKKHQLTANTTKKEIIKCQPDKENQSPGQESNSQRTLKNLGENTAPQDTDSKFTPALQSPCCEDLSYLDPSLKMYSQLTSYLATLWSMNFEIWDNFIWLTTS